jgi:hypothetical protein
MPFGHVLIAVRQSRQRRDTVAAEAGPSVLSRFFRENGTFFGSAKCNGKWYCWEGPVFILQPQKLSRKERKLREN